MRKYFVFAVAAVCLLFVLGVMAQTSTGTRGQSTTTTTTTTTTNQTTTSGPQRSVEGCVVKEASDYFLIPRTGHPIELQPSAGEDLSAHEGHRVKIQGVESSMSAAAGAGSMGTGGTAGAAANMPPSSTQAAGMGAAGSVKSQAGGTEASTGGAATGTGNDLHRLANRQMSVVKITHMAETCPVNWNPSVSTRSTPKR